MTNDQLSLDHETQVETFRRMVFNIMSRNCDDHTKNFSFILRKEQGWALARQAGLPSSEIERIRKHHLLLK